MQLLPNPGGMWLGILLALIVTTGAPLPSAEAAQCPSGFLFPAVDPTSNTDPQVGLTDFSTFTTPMIDANSLQKYVTPVPNALTPGFIYTPSGTQGGEPWYQVSMRQITQSVGLIYNNPKNPNDPNNGCTAAPATIWAYGDARDNGTTTAPTAPHSYPGPTFEARSNVPHRVTWTNELPAAHPLNVDPTLDCGPMAPGCFPFNRAVPHVHGAHVADNSDGNPDAWFTPNFAITGHMWTPNTQFGPAGTYRYDNSQEAGTVWYHDHAMGLTHINVYAGLAGFNIIRDQNEITLQNNNVLPQYPFENALAIQDRVFTRDGKLYNPDQPILNIKATLTGVACDNSTGAADPYACGSKSAGSLLPDTTPCDPSEPPGNKYACPPQLFTRSADGAITPVAAGTPGAVTFPSITPEFWGNIILVNGQVWPKQDVEKRVYRFRWLNGSDSRSYILRLMLKDLTTGKVTVPPASLGLDLWQIGTDDAFLAKPLKPMVNDPTLTNGVAGVNQCNAIVLMPGERIDTLIDFSNVPAGTAIVLYNLGPDVPYTDEYPPSSSNGQETTTIVPEIMLFNVVGTMSAAAPTTAPG
ncbi:MAG TPA: multicopper oxidase domain-containing protein, partial [Desulfuromonadaceae bacterium]